jgi:hypothetical protein
LLGVITEAVAVDRFAMNSAVAFAFVTAPTVGAADVPLFAVGVPSDDGFAPYVAPGHSETFADMFVTPDCVIVVTVPTVPVSAFPSHTSLPFRAREDVMFDHVTPVVAILLTVTDVPEIDTHATRKFPTVGFVPRVTFRVVPEAASLLTAC